MTTALITSQTSLAFANELLSEQETALAEAQKILAFAQGEGFESLAVAQEKKIGPITQRLGPLAMGYLPVTDQGHFDNLTDTYKYARERAQRAMRTVPPEIREAFEEAQKTGNFTSFSIGGAYRGDPVLVGNAGGWRFFIGAWVPLRGGHSIGLRYMPKLLEGKGK